MFHVADGLYFDRLDEGSVHIRKETKEADSTSVLFEQTISPSEWASIVAAVSHPENQDGAHDAANKLHMEPAKK